MVAKSRLALGTNTVITGTRYGNVLASRGSVIPLFVDQVRKGIPITITDPTMTRFVMTLGEAVDLVLYAFEHGQNGDLFVQKAPAATIDVLAKSVLEILGAEHHPVRVIGTRHGEKLYEALLSREELVMAEDRGDYYRVPPDSRDLNYSAFVEQGERQISHAQDFHSHNARRLDQSEMADILRRLDYMQAVLAGRESGTQQ
jgi:UDP-glucose 4-epimerase